MPGSQGYKKEVWVATSSTDTFYMLPTTTANLNIGGDILDDTDATSSGTRSRLYGLDDWSIGATCNMDSTSQALTVVRNAKLNKTDVFARYFPMGSSLSTLGFQGNGKVESYNMSGDVGGVETVETSINADGALSAST